MKGLTDTTVKSLNNNKSKKVNSLRYNEYYNMQEMYDYIYQEGKNRIPQRNLMEAILNPHNIMLAYRSIKRNKGSLTKGTNRTTILDWEKASQEDYIEYVHKRLANFQPHKIKRKMIPKANGSFRPLGIPTIEDRLIQQCIKQVLEPYLEAQFYSMSFGFRPNRSAKHAVAEFQGLINLGKNYHVINVDIKGFFDNINHGKLLKQLWTLGIHDKYLLSIISKMLKAEIEGLGFSEKGTPQGGILSPLLANVVLNELDWWVDSQWVGFPTKRIYSNEPNKFAELKKTKLKEVRIVRYADDFKIVCKKRYQAERMYYAVQDWLTNRLNLDISQEKSGLVDIRKQTVDFLGLSFKAEIKGFDRYNKPKYVLFSHMSEKAIESAGNKLKNRVIEIQKRPNYKNVYLYNSTVLGLQNYYKIATHCNLDFGRIAYRIDRIIYNRLRNFYKTTGTIDATYKRLYKNKYKKIFVDKICLYPIHDIQTRSEMRFNQRICNYTPEGRALIHDQLSGALTSIISYLLQNPLPNGSVELNDNRLSRYCGQKGKCYISDEQLEINNMQLHHIKPKTLGGDDNYRNVVWVTTDVHRLIHATKEETILKYKNKLNLSEKRFSALNKLRRKAGNSVLK